MSFATRLSGFRRSSVVIAVVIIVSVVAGPSSSRGQATTFINLKIPAPWNDRNPTWVLKATTSSIVVAQISRFKGRNDIRVIEVEKDRFHDLGENGRSVTGVEVSNLHTAARSSDGRLWIMAEYSRFANQIPGNQFCLYVFENDRWNAIGPPFGAPREHSWNNEEHGLYFFADNLPITVSIHAKIQGMDSTWRHRLRRLEGERWITLPGQTYISDRFKSYRFVWRKNDAWLFEIDDMAAITNLAVRRIRDPDPRSVAGSIQIDSWEEKIMIFHTAVAPDGLIAVHGCPGEIAKVRQDQRHFIKIYRQTDKGGYHSSNLPALPTAVGAIQNLEWSPTGMLHVINVSREKITVNRYTNDDWEQVGEAKQRREFETIIMNPRLFFRDDGLPIVTWEEFTTVDQSPAAK